MANKEKTTSLEGLSVTELIARVKSQEAHIIQLKNLLVKAQKPRKDTNSKKQAKQKPFDFNRYTVRHVAIKFVYLGWDMQGFAVQEDTENTVEAAVFEALLRTKLIQSRETSCYHRCGRTDKGVSAFSQVISLDVRSNLLEGVGVKVYPECTAHERSGDKTTEIAYVHILNQVLPPEIRVLAWAPVDGEFSARFSCFRRTYKYFFPLANLDIPAMRAAAKKLHGEHDYRNFCKMDVGNGVTNFVRNIQSTDITILDSETSDGFSMCELTVIGQAFLWHQIRCLVAILFLVGQGHETPEVVDELLDVQKHPQKPQYSMAAEFPLVLFDCEFENVNWTYGSVQLKDTLHHLQQLWTKHSVKATMIKRMVDNLASVSEEATTSDSPAEASNHGSGDGKTSLQSCWRQMDCLLPGSKARTYKPLLERNTCGQIHHTIMEARSWSNILEDDLGIIAEEGDRVVLFYKELGAKVQDGSVDEVSSVGDGGIVALTPKGAECMEGTPAAIEESFTATQDQSSIFHYSEVVGELPIAEEQALLLTPSTNAVESLKLGSSTSAAEPVVPGPLTIAAEPCSSGPAPSGVLGPVQPSWSCDVCSKRLGSKDGLRRHKKKHTGDMLKCPHCPRSFYDRYDLAQHIPAWHLGQEFSCMQCPKKFKHKVSLRQHEKCHAGQFDYRCNICGQGFCSKQDYTEHVNRHHGIKPHKCKCGADFVRRRDLNFHLSICGNKKVFHCDHSHCGKLFKSPRYVKLHMKAHTAPESFVCSVCSKMYSYAASLNKHIKKHHK